ncbi:unnamed protein product [Xylocopa violacea]|uniref:Chitin-binding type-2 domain-containing protein n=1 Tax=Xylocopa violacea TaxID=135666 RepID=A0ABP1P7Q7_XYLVO
MHFSNIFIFAFCTVTFAYRLDGNYVEVHDIEPSSLRKPHQLPPLDPAIHSFPTMPTAPLIPVCTKEGYFRDPFNCSKFYYCQYRNAVPKAFYCQHGLIFNPDTNSCDDLQRVDC